MSLWRLHWAGGNWCRECTERVPPASLSPCSLTTLSTSISSEMRTRGSSRIRYNDWWRIGCTRSPTTNTESPSNMSTA